MRFKGLSKATGWQTATYLFGVALFSISFLVFLNSSVSFVITDLIGQKHDVGNSVGTLGFADELVALVACPIWGVTSDRLGVRNVCVLGYLIIGLSLFVFVQAKNVYPQLLLARLLFSVGGAATTTMVTAILPAITVENVGKTGPSSRPDDSSVAPLAGDSGRSELTSAAEADVTPAIYQRPLLPRDEQAVNNPRSTTSQVAGFVGMFTGIGALVALALFLPLPDRLQKGGLALTDATIVSYYIVGSVAFVVAIFCAFGLRGLRAEEGKGWKAFLSHKAATSNTSDPRKKISTYSELILQSVRLGITDVSVGLGYLGGFVARASSVGISLFIPLYVNAYFISSGRCTGVPGSVPDDVKRQCGRAYSVAAALSGSAEAVALLVAPVFGYLDARYGWLNAPLLIASVSGIVGYVLLANTPEPDISKHAGPVLLTMALLGISQIGAIVCSLSLLSRSSTNSSLSRSHDEGDGRSVGEGIITDDETSPLLASEAGAQIPPVHFSATPSVPGPSSASPPSSRGDVKGSIAGVYSLSGGAGILILTKLGGYLFDKSSPAAPFYMLAIFNAILLVIGVLCTITVAVRPKKKD